MKSDMTVSAPLRGDALEGLRQNLGGSLEDLQMIVGIFLE